jgi:HD superfamily phosphohydrolase
MIKTAGPSTLYRDQRAKTFTIPAVQSVVLYGPEIDIIGTPEFQRLDGIKQLATAYLAYRGAKHSRFEHSLGTLHRADQMVRAINENPRRRAPVDDRGWRLTRLTALLHDLSHIPFGHTLEDELGLLERHDRNRPRMDALLVNSEIGRIVTTSLADYENDGEAKSEWEELQEILDPEIETAELRRPYIRDIVGNTVCADALDYIERDLAACGMPGTIGTRFLDFLTITPESAPSQHRWRTALSLEKRGMPRPDVESEVVKLLTYRYELAERVYFHHAKNSASVMLGRAVADSGLIPIQGVSNAEDARAYDCKFWKLTDELLLRVIQNPAVADALDLDRDAREPEEVALASELAKGIMERSLYKIAFLAPRDDLRHSVERIWADYGTAVQRRALEDSMADLSGIKRGHVLLHLPRPSGLAKLADVRVLADHEEIVSLEEWDREHSGRLAAINTAHARLWRVTVYVHPQIDKAASALVRALATDIFGAPSRYQREAEESNYTQELFRQNASSNGWTVSDSLAISGSRSLRFGRTLDDARNELEGLISAYRARKHADPGDSRFS